MTMHRITKQGAYDCQNGATGWHYPQLETLCVVPSPLIMNILTGLTLSRSRRDW